jgi:hypothetical protein
MIFFPDRALVRDRSPRVNVRDISAENSIKIKRDAS